MSSIKNKNNQKPQKKGGTRGRENIRKCAELQIFPKEFQVPQGLIPFVVNFFLVLFFAFVCGCGRACESVCSVRERERERSLYLSHRY